MKSDKCIAKLRNNPCGAKDKVLRVGFFNLGGILKQQCNRNDMQLIKKTQKRVKTGGLDGLYSSFKSPNLLKIFSL